MKDYKYFSADELRCKCGECDGGEMNDSFMDSVIGIREAAGFPFVVVSAYRCPAHNNAVSKTGFDGPHTTGRAIDIRAVGEDAFEIVDLACKSDYILGIGVHQKGDWSGRFIHLDDLEYPRPRIWSY